MVLLLHSAGAGTYPLTDGTSVEGVPASCDDAGILLQTGDNSFSPRIAWGKFTDDALRQLLKDVRTPRDRAIIEPMLLDKTSLGKPAAPAQITVNPVQTPSRPSGHLGVLAILASPLGWIMLLILYGANLFAAYEVAVFRNQPVETVCGLAAIPFFGVAATIYFLAQPSIPREGGEPDPSNRPAVAPAHAPIPLGSAATGTPDPAPSPAYWEPPAPNPAETAPAQPDLPAPVVYQRGEFSFNRRFFETKMPGFFRVVLSDADKNMLIYVKAVRGEFVGKRICRITPAELGLQVFKDNATAEEMIPFVEILEVQIRHKDLPRT
jgi:hypothetical protein